MEHEWQPTDTQGYEMICTRCGQFVSLLQENAGDIIDAPCCNIKSTNRKPHTEE